MNKTVRMLMTAAAAASMISAAQAAPALTIQSYGTIKQPVALLNDGRAVLPYYVFTFPDPSTCAPSHYPTSCAYPSTSFEGLRLTGPGQPTQDLTDNYWVRRFVVSHTGKVANWPISSESQVSLLDIATGVSAPFAGGAAAPSASLGCSTDTSQTPFWRGISDAGVLVGQPMPECPKPDSLFLWSDAGAQEITTPTGYHFVAFGGINATNQIFVNAYPTKSPSEATRKAFVWNKTSGYKALTAPTLSALLGYSGTYAAAMNDTGDVAGYLSNKTSGQSHAAVWRGGVATDIGIRSGYKYSYAIGITSTGMVIACGNNTATWSAGGQMFLWDKGSITKPWAPSVAADGSAIPAIDCAYAKYPGPFLANQKGQWVLNGSVPIPDTNDMVNHYLVSPLN